MEDSLELLERRTKEIVDKLMLLKEENICFRTQNSQLLEQRETARNTIRELLNKLRLINS